ncbi:MAG: hypothetical protein ACLFVQ_13100 [Chitinispirillaceae bacterium]
MASVLQDAIDILKGMPDDATLEDIVEELENTLGSEHYPRRIFGRRAKITARPEVHEHIEDEKPENVEHYGRREGHVAQQIDKAQEIHTDRARQGKRSVRK